MSDALERTKRALDLIPYVLEHQGISLEDLAKKFNVSTERLYEDLNLIFCCGLPGYTPLELIDMNFEDGFVSVTNPQSLDIPRKLSKQELLRLHLGLELCAKFSTEQVLIRIKRIQEQILKFLHQNSPIEIINQSESKLLAPIVQALRTGSNLVFDYKSANSDSERTRNIFPTGISENMNNIYLEGVELESGLSKIFRLDRIANLKVETNLNGEITGSVPAVINFEIILHVASQARNFLVENSAIIFESHQLPSGFEVRLRGVSENWLISEIFAYGGAIRVIEPASFKRKLGEIAKNRLSKV